MKQKKWLIPILSLVLLVQMLAPAGLILYHENLNRQIDSQGTQYRIPVLIDAVYEGTVQYSFVDTYLFYSGGGANYIALDTDGNGVTQLYNCYDEQPPTDIPYIRCVNRNAFPYKRTVSIADKSLVYSSEPRFFDYSAEKEQEMAIYRAVSYHEWFLHIAVYKGNCTVRGIYDKDGVPCEQALLALLSA